MKSKKCNNSKSNANMEAGSELSPDVKPSADRCSSVDGGKCTSSKK